MTARAPLPPALAHAAFGVDELLDAGLPWDRTRAADLHRIWRGVYTAADPAALTWDRAAALCRVTGGVISHTTAAAWHGIPLPRRLEASEELHLTVDRGRRQHRSALPGVVTHRLRLPPQEVRQVGGGLRVTSPERTWLDLAVLLRPWELDWLVVAGDHLVHHPWHPDGRRPPATTPALLDAALGRHAGRHGIRRAREALADVRVGADSAPETRLRLALIRAGLPEPELQVAVDPSDPRSPEADLGYRDARIALQYDGAAHRTPEQQARDARREAYCLERDWLPLRCTQEDLREGFTRVIGVVRRRLASRGAFGATSRG